jgi:hypothetical protein
MFFFIVKATEEKTRILEVHLKTKSNGSGTQAMVPFSRKHALPVKLFNKKECDKHINVKKVNYLGLHLSSLLLGAGLFSAGSHGLMSEKLTSI